MTFQILIATMHQKDHSLLDKMNLTSNAVVINQCDNNGKEIIKHNDKDVLWINTTERGLSRSRNMAIKNATADICLIADDDEVFLDDCETTILKEFEKYKDYSILRFQVEGIEKPFKTYPNEGFPINRLKSFKTSSVEIAFRREKIANKIFFDEKIGAGTKFYMGEENAFLMECFRHGIKMFYIPKKIAQLHIGDSSWFEGYTEKYFISRGASYAAMKTNATFLLIFQFAIRKYGIYKNDFPLFKSIKYMFQGAKQYKLD